MNKEEILQRLADIKQERARIQAYLSKEQKALPPTRAVAVKPKVEGKNLQPGVSVVIPTYKGEALIERCLQSLANQTLSRASFEVLVVINGEKDNTEQVIQSFMQREQMNNIKVHYQQEPGASLARNKGIELATRQYLTFLDDDDTVSESFLEVLWKHAQEERAVISQIVDVKEDGTLIWDNAINKQIMEAPGKEGNPLFALSMILTANACKLIPTKYAKLVSYDVALKSGEDVVYFTELLTSYNLELTVAPIEEKAIYYRHLRDNSISRRALSFAFNVQERLAVIQRLNDLLPLTTDPDTCTFIKQKVNAQSLFINRFLQAHPQEWQRVMKEIRTYQLSYLPYALVNRGLANMLVVAYCFPPYVDTSGNVMAKRLCEQDKVVDVVYNQMDKVRKTDESLNQMVDHLIETRIPIPSYPSFSNWKAIQDFTVRGLEKIKELEQKKGPYKHMYSRVMWPGSQFLAFAYKLKHPNVNWTAEFSDPILLDIYGKERYAKIEDEDFIKRAQKLLRKKKLPVVQNDNLFFWCEYLAYAFADKLIFTNENQLKYMLDTFPVKGLKSLIRKKAKVSNQPTLPKRYYELEKSEYRLDEKKANVAYFGTFYGTRKLDELFEGIQHMQPALREKLQFHIFTSDPDPILQDIKGSEIEQNVRVNPYVGFFEFLNLTTRFDCLVVNDALTKEYKSINPYLPSKLSDYLGSGRAIWGLFEEGSVLSSYPLPYKSEVGSVKGATAVFEQIVQDKNKQ